MDDTLDTAPCGYISFSDSGQILAVNRTLADLVGRTPGALAGKPLETILTVASRIFYQTHFFPLLKMSGKVDEVYMTLRPTSALDLPVLVNAVRREREGESINECVLVPMHRRNQYEDEILAAKRALEEANAVKDSLNDELSGLKADLERKSRELQERNCELEVLREQLEEQVRTRTAELRIALEDIEGFSYAIAHDLRTPLRAIVATSAILAAEASGTLSAEHLALLGRQSHNATRLSTLIDDLLRFARLGREGIERVPVNLSELATDVIAEMATRSGGLNPTFSVEAGMRATGEPSLVRLVLENLLGNAVKYSPEAGEIRVGVRKRDGVFFVADEGIGFDPVYADKIFLPFERLHPPGEYEGNGIGLATVRRIVERHGGKVWAESRPGQGSTFYFTLAP